VIRGDLRNLISLLIDFMFRIDSILQTVMFISLLCVFLSFKSVGLILDLIAKMYPMIHFGSNNLGTFPNNFGQPSVKCLTDFDGDGLLLKVF